MLNVKKLFTQVLTKLKSLDTNKLNTSGGTVTGDIVVQKSSTASVHVTASNSSSGVKLMNSGTYVGLYGVVDTDWIIRYDSSNGKVGLRLNTDAASTTVDGKLTAAIDALGWRSDVIVT